MNRTLRSAFCSPLLAAVSLQARPPSTSLACEPEWASLATELGGDSVKVTVADHGACRIRITSRRGPA